MYRALKKLRVIISLLFFLVLGLYFVDFTGLWHGKIPQAFLKLQFLPSLMLFTETLEFLALGFAVIIILTLLFGRLYCSSLCPLGTLQDLFIYMSGKLSPRKKIFRFKSPNNWLRYGFLILSALSLATGFIFFVNMLDPYSAFGRIAHNLAWPPILLANNLLAQLLASFGIFFVYPVKWVGMNYFAVGLALSWLVLLLFLSVKRGRLYCNTVCPVGTLLGLLSRFSLFRIVLDKSVCNSCGKCSVVCKAECIDPKIQELDFSRCVGCLNCLSPCPDGGVKYRPFWAKEKISFEVYDPGRREVFRNTGILALGSVVMKKDTLLNFKKKETVAGTVPIFREHPVTPPGAKEQARFNSLCTACHLCVATCPTQVLQPSYLMYGLKGILQPRMDYITSFCNYECKLCSEVCPTGAILPLALEEKKRVQLGKAKFVKENCVVETQKTDCGACSEHCPTKAVKMIPYWRNLTIPEVTEDICVGCGACEYACPTDPKSIYVEGNVTHQKAKEPVQEKLDTEIDYKEEFPF
jgi:ferredoxin